MAETQDHLTVPVLVSVTLQFLTSTSFVYCHFILLLAISCFPIAQLSHVPSCWLYTSLSLFLSLPFILQLYAIIIMVMQTSFLYALLHLLLFCTTSSCFVCIHTSCGFTSSSLHSLDHTFIYVTSQFLVVCSCAMFPRLYCRGHMT